MNGIILLFSPTDNIVLWPLSCIFAKIFQIVLWHPYYYWKKIKVPLQNVKSSFEKIQLCLLTACILAWVYCSNFLPIIMKTPFNYCRLGRQCVTIYDDSIVPLWAKIGRNTKKNAAKRSAVQSVCKQWVHLYFLVLIFLGAPLKIAGEVSK